MVLIPGVRHRVHAALVLERGQVALALCHGAFDAHAAIDVDSDMIQKGRHQFDRQIDHRREGIVRVDR